MRYIELKYLKDVRKARPQTPTHTHRRASCQCDAPKSCEIQIHAASEPHSHPPGQSKQCFFHNLPIGKEKVRRQTLRDAYGRVCGDYPGYEARMGSSSIGICIPCSLVSKDVYLAFLAFFARAPSLRFFASFRVQCQTNETQ